jgi:hypothetical protein
VNSIQWCVKCCGFMPAENMKMCFVVGGHIFRVNRVRDS